MTNKTKFKLNYLFTNLEGDIMDELAKVRDGKDSDIEMLDIAKNILSHLAPYGKDIHFHYNSMKWRKIRKEHQKEMSL